MPSKKQNIVLIGFYGTGKKRIGKALADLLALPFADLDIETEYVLGESVSSFTIKRGWQVYREIEQRVVHDFSRNFSGVLSSGVGCLENSKSLDSLKKTSSFILLNPPFEDIKDYVLEHLDHVPFIQLDDTNELIDELYRLWEQRMIMYKALADIVFVPNLKADPIDEAKRLKRVMSGEMIPTSPEKKRIAVLTEEPTDELYEFLDLKKRGRIPHIDIDIMLTIKPSKTSKTSKNKRHNEFINELEVIQLDSQKRREDLLQDVSEHLKDRSLDHIIMKKWAYGLQDGLRDKMGAKTVYAKPWLMEKYDSIPLDELYIKILEDAEKYAGCTLIRSKTPFGEREHFMQRKFVIQNHHTAKELQQSITRQIALIMCEYLEKR